MATTCYRHGAPGYPCCPSVCSDYDCEYRARAFMWYLELAELVDDLGVDWCRDKCSQPCEEAFLGGGPCDFEIENILDSGLLVEDILDVDLSEFHRIVNLAKIRVQKRIQEMIDAGRIQRPE